MLSYRHAFHAGNHADVLKHFILVQLLEYLGKKETPYWYIDTHAGAGLYALDSGYAAKNAEYREGIGRFWERQDLPGALAGYVAAIRAFNPDGALRFYPGSPLLARALVRPVDRLRLFELHPADSRLLQDNCRDLGRRAQLQATDGFAGLKALLPPPPRRAVTLIDPPYEDKQDYKQVVDCLKEALTRFATGTYAVWHPLLQRPEARQLPDRLKRLPATNWLHVALTVRAPSADGFGMHGSGMFIINPPWVLHDVLRDTLPWLADVLGMDATAGFALEQQGN